VDAFDATDEKLKAVFLVLEFAEGVTVEALVFQAGEGVEIIAMPGGAP
jgi:hypothetical protein